jgi:phosphonate transport system substrate-binding protein
MRLRFLTFLSPNARPLHEAVVRAVAARIGVEATLEVGGDYDEAERADVAFLCSIPYVARAEVLDPIAAPVLTSARGGGAPIYFSDVVVHRDAPFRSFDDLRGARFAFNEPESQSGFGVVRDRLARGGHAFDGFARFVRVGFHERALSMIASRAIDAAAIDEHVLMIAKRDDPSLDEELCTLEVLGPSPIQPVVASRRLDASLRAALRVALVSLADDVEIAREMQRSFVARYVSVDDAHYEPVRRAQCAAAEWA